MKWKLLRQEERQQPTVAPGFRQSSQRCGWRGLLRGQAGDQGQGLTLGAIVPKTLPGPLSSPAAHRAKAHSPQSLSPSCTQGQAHPATIPDFLERLQLEENNQGGG